MRFFASLCSNIKVISGHLCRSIFIFANGAHMHDPTSIICKLEFVTLFNVFRAENHLHIEIKWVGTGLEKRGLPFEENVL